MDIKSRLEQLLAGQGPNYIFPFFWQHGEDEATLREYMRVIHGASIGAVCVESRPHPDFLGPKWWADLDAILDEAQKLDMRVWILDDVHFPTGYAAGAVETAPAELCHQYLDYNAVSVCGPKPGILLDVEKLSHPKTYPPWFPSPPPPKRVFHDDRLLKVLACPLLPGGEVGESVDLTSLVRDGWLEWNAPKGWWKIFVIYLTRDAQGRNDYINLLDKNSCRLLLDTVYEPYFARYEGLFGNTIAGFFSDEPPIGNSPGYTPGNTIGKPDIPLPWSAAMPGRIQNSFGDGWELMLPLLWTQGEDGQKTARARVAFMDAVTALVAECFSQQIGNWCVAHGVEYIGHMVEGCDDSGGMGPSMGHFFRGLSGQHMAGIDTIGGEVLPGGQYLRRGRPPYDNAAFYQYTLGRMGASHAAIDPKKKGRCMVEDYGAYGWQIGVRTEKYLTDHFLARGVNHFVPHAFTPKAFPDPDCPPHFYAHGENPQYRAFGHLMAYANRICHLIDGGVPHAPVAVLYHGESQWAGEYESNIHVCRQLARAQTGFTLIPADIFSQPEVYNTVFCPEDRTLKVNGLDLKLLVVSGGGYLPKAAADFIAEALPAGFPVLFSSCIPMGVSDVTPVENDVLMNTIRRAPVCPLPQLAQAVHTHLPPDIRLDEPFEDLTAYRYHNGQDVLILLNEHPNETFDGTVQVDLPGAPVLYDAWGNRLAGVAAEQLVDGTRLHIVLEPLEMAVILFGTGQEAGPNYADEPVQSLVIPAESFTVSRCEARAYPAFHSPEPPDFLRGIGMAHPEFSGYYRYETVIRLPAHEKAVLQIDDVYETAEVFVNGDSVGLLTAPPYRFELSGTATEGENAIAIEVATTLERKVAAMGEHLSCLNIPAPLSPTGIIGRVSIALF